MSEALSHDFPQAGGPGGPGPDRRGADSPVTAGGPAVPDIPTLRAICHRDKLEKDRRLWYAASRNAAIYLTWVLAHTGVTANQVTLLCLTLALAGAVLLATPSPLGALGGAAALAAYHLLDKVDGDIARLRRTFSIVGVYLDEVGHAVAFGGIFVGLGLHLAWTAATVQEAVLVLGAAAVGGIAMVLARQHKSAGFLLFAQHVLFQPALLPDRSRARGPHPLSREGAHRSRRGASSASGAGARALVALREAVLFMADFVVILALAIVGLVLQQVTGQPGFLRGVLVGEALLQVAVLGALVWINCSVNIEAECLRLDAQARSRDARLTND